MSDRSVDIANYSLTRKIHQSSRSIIYQGCCNSRQQSAIIKVSRSEYPSIEELEQFRNQYAIAKNLHLSGIVKPYSLENYRNGYALIMEDFGGISLVKYNLSHLGEFLSVAIQLATILDGLYSAHIVHKDIKPSNILINPETKQVKLIDFSCASLLSEETHTTANLSDIQGTLAYISPEQTGRTNREIDYRSDFYSLGVTFYELLVGTLPFQSDDPMELVHCHIAQMPPVLRRGDGGTGGRGEIPQMLSDIVFKLMAKNAEDRYQSALGLKYDLEKCLYQWQENGTIEPFELGERDICARFAIPEKLYGRETEVATLLATFERVAGKRPELEQKQLRDPAGIRSAARATFCPLPTISEMILVVGEAGIGKTATVNAIKEPVIDRQGYFIQGKFEQSHRNIPFFAFVQALRDLMNQLLCESDAQLEQWKTKILAAVGENGQVIIDVIPELKRIIGQQPPVPKLSSHAATHRFNLLFQKFIQIFATQAHPLALFLDDLHWIDLSSLKLIYVLMSSVESRYLLLIGAYRESEIQPTSSLLLTLDALHKTGTPLNRIPLAPLAQEDINHLIADTLNCSEKQSVPLTQPIYQKTQGNPFFVTQFLKSLYEDGLITFNPVCSIHQGEIEGGWQCDINKIRKLALTNDVVSFIALQLQKLPASTQNVLKLAACMGNQFDLELLALVAKQSPEETASNLWKALQDGLIIEIDKVYKFSQIVEPRAIGIAEETVAYQFAHSRIRQAAYSLIPDAEQQAVHLTIGKFLWQRIPETQREEKIFEVVSLLNRGRGAILSGYAEGQQKERDELARLNGMAAQKAKAANAYATALDYLKIGIELLGEKGWETQYDLALMLHESAAEISYLTGNLQQMEKWVADVVEQAKTVLDAIDVYEVKIQAWMAQGKPIKAVRLGLQVLQKLGLELSEVPTALEIEEGLQEIITLLQGKDIPDLLDLPRMEDEQTLALMKILSSLGTAAFLCAPQLFVLNVFAEVKLSIQWGNSPFSTLAYASYGTVLHGLVGDVEGGYQFGNLALSLAERLKTNTLKTKAFFATALTTKYLKEPLRQTLLVFQEAYASGLENGELEYASLAATARCSYSFFAGQELGAIEEDIVSLEAILREFGQSTALHQHQLLHQVVCNYLEPSEKPWILGGEIYDEKRALPLLRATHNQTTIHILFLHKSILGYLLGEYDRALDYAKEAERYLPGVLGMFHAPLFYFYDSLTRLGMYATAPEAVQEEILAKVERNQEKMKGWARSAPMNFQHKYDLVEAQKYRLLGQTFTAIEFYDRAIAGAKANKYVQEEALANELAIQLYLDWGKERIAQLHAIEAYYCYVRWGAIVKVKDLERRYSTLLAPIFESEPRRGNLPLTPLQSSNTDAQSALDWTAAMKASQVLSSEMKLDKLLFTLMQVVMENAGAERGALILPEGGEWSVAVSCPEVRACSFASTPLQVSRDVPINIINRVKRTAETFVIDDVMAQSSLAIDPYLARQRPKSLLCSPILAQGKLLGILYLENKLTVGAFTRDRVEILNLLCAQGAVSLENARLYQRSQNYAQQLESTVRELQQTQDQLQQSFKHLQQAQLQMVQSEKMSALGNLVAGVAHEINNPVGFIAGNLQPAQHYVQDLLGLLDLYQEKYPDPHKEITEEIDAIDLEFVREDLPKLIVSMKEGTNRIGNISKSLRTFSRTDSDSKVLFDLHSGLDSTLLILKHRLKGNNTYPAIEMIKEYGELPAIKCYPGQLNQVFMNLIANAIEAIEESAIAPNKTQNEAIQPKIWLKTEVVQDAAIVRIRDNGAGIPDAVKQRIFDHLFTTKGVDKGTGLGLAIARQIIEEKHGGTISCTSELGNGTEFAIELPLT
ncbi:AAA family ATPase [Lusitaniella coriacea LEGE 07157]|uniref:histidine kinase n=1 Tax=Lusitaniella coriacea LEGE 07157 TaxID=945747 RepID=A0A8J7DNJ9_9CYAN|nr:ATP-binding sensor histidine kinase [Lusitaniella coriacea]MBE9114729.1 AAA family ATPase [Lusitaniella coriacea LEGE 07157]